MKSVALNDALLWEKYASPGRRFSSYFGAAHSDTQVVLVAEYDEVERSFQLRLILFYSFLDGLFSLIFTVVSSYSLVRVQH